jgi:Ser/Thr protein kinase RdoA (MazF antagonist)
MDAIVFGAIAFAVIFTIAWAISPALREWIERPKYGFQQSLEAFEELARKENHR